MNRNRLFALGLALLGTAVCSACTTDDDTDSPDTIVDPSAIEFVLADHFFSESLAPSSPGHEVFWFGRSTTIDNPTCHLQGGKGCGVGCDGTHLTATAFNPKTGVEHKVKPCFMMSPSRPAYRSSSKNCGA